MLKSGILNPHILDLIARVRHTNTLVIADWAFPFWPEIETVDISLTHGIPTVLDVLDLLTPVFKIGKHRAFRKIIR
jgi:D-ribose pyranase